MRTTICGIKFCIFVSIKAGYSVTTNLTCTYVFECVFECVLLPVFCVHVWPCAHQPLSLLSSVAALSLQSIKIALVVSLADVAGRSPGDRRGETNPTKWHELMWLINATLIICKLHVWVHVTWEAYAACCVRPNKCQLICISGVASVWRRANQHGAGKKKAWRSRREGKRVKWKKNKTTNKCISSRLDSMLVFCHTAVIVWSLFLCAVGEFVICLLRDQW